MGNTNSDTIEEGTTGQEPKGMTDIWTTMMGVGVQGGGEDKKKNIRISLSEQGSSLFILRLESAQSPHTFILLILEKGVSSLTAPEFFVYLAISGKYH